MTLHNIQEYKRAKVVVKDLEKTLKLLTATETGLKAYAHYRAVGRILTTISEYKPYIQIFLDECKIIVESKGRKGL